MVIIKKGVFSLGLIMISLLLTTTYVSANEMEIDIVFDSSQAFYDPEIGEWIQPFQVNQDGSIVILTQEEYYNEIESSLEEEEILETDQFITSNDNLDLVTILDNYREYWVFVSSGSRYTQEGSTLKVSPDIYCNTGTCSASITVGVTVSHGFSTTVSAERSVIQASAGSSWQVSASNEIAFTYNLINGDQGYIGFIPYFWRIDGKLERHSNWDGKLYEKSAWGRYPKLTANNLADGRYFFVYTKRSPIQQ